MAVSILLAKQVLKLFLILLLGYILVKSGKLKASDSKSVSVILVYLVIPCMIINSFQIDYTPQVRNGLIFTMAVSVAVHISGADGSSSEALKLKDRRRIDGGLQQRRHSGSAPGAVHVRTGVCGVYL